MMIHTGYGFSARKPYMSYTQPALRPVFGRKEPTPQSPSVLQETLNLLNPVHRDMTGMLLSEIFELPDLIRHDLFFDSSRELLPEMVPSNKHDRVEILGVGSSRATTEAMMPMLRTFLQIPITLRDPSDWFAEGFIEDVVRDKEAASRKNPFYVAISQSGETGGVIRAMKSHLESKHVKTGRPFLALTNYPGSTLAQNSAQHLPIQAGSKERSFVTTKTSAMTSIKLLQWGILAGLANKTITSKQAERFRMDLRSVPEVLDKMQTNEWLQNKLFPFALSLSKGPSNNAALFSYGPLSRTLREGKWKLMETARFNVTYADSSEAFTHGPKAVLQENRYKLIYVVPPEPEQAEHLFRDMRNHFENVDSTRHRIYIVRFENSPPIPADLAKRLKLLKHPERELVLPKAENLMQQPMMVLNTFYLLAAFLPAIQGKNPNAENLIKTVIQS
ncbi:MAG: hypothetical protein KTR14_03690 [Vampirovibrio sp.]|nr:hypothetical protein [Vampirovibrio sp.]